MTFDVATLYHKHQNENLDVQALQWYYLFVWEMATSHLNLTAKTGKWNEFAEILRMV
jgi:hypothetical protein